MLERAKQRLSYLVLRVLICVIQALPLDTCERLAEGLATVCCTWIKIRRRLVDDNLRLAFPEMPAEQRRHLAWGMWRHLFLLVFEVAHAPRKIHETNWRDYLEPIEPQILTNALLSDRPVLIVSAHFGNFELAGFLLGVLGFPTFTVARTLDHPDVDAYLNRFRGATGQQIIPKKGGYDDILRVLSAGGAMTFLADQYAGTKGCWVEFFGRPASAHKAIALLALEHNAPILVGSAQRVGGPLKYEMRIHGVLDPRDGGEAASGIRPLTQWYTTQLEKMVRRAPEQYWWLHRRWKDNRPVKKKRAAVAPDASTA